MPRLSVPASILLLMFAYVERHVQVDDSDKAPVLVKQGDVGRADFLALNVELSAGLRQDVGDINVSGDSRGEWNRPSEGNRLEPHDLNVARAPHLDRLSLRLARVINPKGENRETKRRPKP